MAAGKLTLRCADSQDTPAGQDRHPINASGKKLYALGGAVVFLPRNQPEDPLETMGF